MSFFSTLKERRLPQFVAAYAAGGWVLLQIVDQRVSTHRMREVCVYRGVQITNEYWAETSGGRLRKSHQWISPEFGYAAITRLKN